MSCNTTVMVDVNALETLAAMSNPLLTRSKANWLIRTSPILPVALAIVLVWGSIATHLWVEWDLANAAAVENTGNLARGFAENVSRTIEGVDQMLKILRNIHRIAPDQFDLDKVAPADETLQGMTVIIAATDKNGRLTSSNLPSDGVVDYADRDHIKYQLQSKGDDLYISRPLLGRIAKRYSLFFTRKMLDNNGNLDGVLSIGMDPNYLSRFYESLTIGHGNIFLVGLNDGIVRARAPFGEKSIGTLASPTTIAQLKSGEPSGSYHGVNRLGGNSLILSYRRIDAYGLAVVVGLATDEVFAQFYSDVRSYVTVGLVVTVLIGLVGFLLARERRSLFAAQDQLTATLQNIAQGIVMANASGRVQVMNQRAVELLGLPSEMVHDGLNLRDMFDWQLAHDEFSEEPVATPSGPLHLRDVAQEGRMVLDTYERVRPNGQTLEVRTQPLATGGAVRSFTDITLRKQTEHALSAARDAAEAASKARSDFLAVVSHEIRTPLNGVIGMAGLLLDGNLPPKERSFAETLRDAADNLLRLINDILDFSKLEANHLTLENTPFTLDEVLSSVVQLQGPKANDNGLYLRSKIDNDVPRQLIGDPGRLRQILLNLVDNGLKFTKVGGVDVSVRLLRRADNRARLLVNVRDTGIGIAPADQARLFQKFAQVDSSTSRRFGGTGLGLAICRRLVEQMNGQISITSEAEQGATFTFTVELEIDGQPVVPAVVEPMSAPGEGLLKQRKSLRVLLAEDNITNRTVATYWLESMGHHVDAACDGNEAVAAMASQAYDIVLMDVMMPEKDGVAATREIRAMPGPVGQTPIVAVTANAFQQHQDACREAGMDAFLTKPIIVRQLVALMERAIDGTLRE